MNANITFPGEKSLFFLIALIFSVSLFAQDTDGDGILDVDDNCIFVPNPDQADSDIPPDGIGDACQPPNVNKCLLNEVVIIMDGSGSVGQVGWAEQKTFVSNLLGSIDGGEGGVSYGIVRFSTGAFIEWELTDDQTIAAIQSAVNNLGYLDGETHTRSALEAAVDIFEGSQTDESNRRIILITDGNPFPFCAQNPCIPPDLGSCPLISRNAAAAIRQDLDDLAVHITIVGVGNGWNPAVLVCLVDNPATQIIEAENFASLDLIQDNIAVSLDLDMDDQDDCLEGTDFDMDGWFSENGDCDDNNNQVNPNQFEVCDGVDNDCDGDVDEGFDTDSDGIGDCLDNCPDTSNPNQDDVDEDGTGDECDLCPMEPDVDSDGDGTPDCIDLCANDPLKIEPGECGCGVPETDTDNDGLCDSVDPDDDNDGCPDEDDINPDIYSGDGDCDGVHDDCDVCPGGDDSIDHNGDGIADCSQLLDYDDYSEQWKCSPNKISVCHNGDNQHTICINKNALPEHFNDHNDFVGPCNSCLEDLVKPIESGYSNAELDQYFDIYPNPANDYINIRFTSAHGDKSLEVFDHLGRLVWNHQLQKDQIHFQIDVHGEGFKSGVYFVRAVIGGEKMIRKLVVLD